VGRTQNLGARYWAVVAAAGGGSRMKVGKPKQYLQLHGQSLIEHSLERFLELGWIDGVVAVLAPGDEVLAKLPVARKPRLHLATGGATRAHSVLSGLHRVSDLAGSEDDRTFVLVHDAARPCVVRKDIERLRDEASDEQGGLLAVPLSDTLKRAENGAVRETLDRRALWRAQTPQLFRLDLLREALETCNAEGVDVTDEAGAMEARGRRPRLVESRSSNIKVTFLEDLALAEFWLARQESER
jgi:2-C-methyl-D-erythritol 4-phosphate cytidylyltransferase